MARVCLGLSLVVTYIIEHFVGRHMVNAIIFHDSPQAWSKKRLLGISILYVSILLIFLLSNSLWFISVLVSMLTSKLGVVISLTGNLSGSIIAFIMPAACFLKSSNISPLDAVRQLPSMWNRSSPKFLPSLWQRLHHLEQIFVPMVMMLLGSVVLLLGSVSSIHHG